MMTQSTLGKILPRTATTFEPFLVTATGATGATGASLLLRPNLFTFDFLALWPMCFEVSLQLLLGGEGSVTAHTEVVSLVDLSPVAAPGGGGREAGITGRADEGFVQLYRRADTGCHWRADSSTITGYHRGPQISVPRQRNIAHLLLMGSLGF